MSQEAGPTVPNTSYRRMRSCILSSDSSSSSFAMSTPDRGTKRTPNATEWMAVVAPSPRRHMQFTDNGDQAVSKYCMTIPHAFAATNLLQTFITFPFVNSPVNKIPAVKNWTFLKRVVPHKKGSKYGILLGKPSDVLVIDLDRMKSDDPLLYVDGVDAWCMIVDKFRSQGSVQSLQDVPTIKTPSGGYHLYFRFDEEVQNKVGGVQRLRENMYGEGSSTKALKIDVLGTNRCVVGPGSPGYTQWDFQKHPPQYLPTWLKAFLLKESIPSSTLKRPSKPSVTATKRSKTVDAQELAALVADIHPSFAATWSPWQRIVRAIAKVGEDLGVDTLPIADDFSKKCASKYKGLDDVRVTFNQRHNDVGLDTLRRFASATPSEVQAGQLNDKGMMDREPFDLVQDLLACKPQLKQRYAACNERSMSGVDGMYRYDDDQGIWVLEHAYATDNMLLKELLPVTQTRGESRTVKGRIHQIREAFARSVYDGTFCDKLDTKKNLFAMRNFVFDTTTRVLRKAKPDDCLTITTGWDYDRELAEAHRADVLQFLQALYPMERERDLALAFVAGMLSGNRTEYKFAIILDELGGRNGKTSFFGFLKRFFGDYHVNGVQFVTGTTKRRDVNSHDGGIFALRGRRIILADETKKTDTLNVGKLKYWTGGADTIEGGRHMHSERRSSFPFQAGIMVACNEGDFPQFDTSDAAIMQRMIVIPMRTKFVTDPTLVDAGQDVLLCDPMITEKFDAWRSAFFDILRNDYFHKRHLIQEENLPLAVVQLRNRIMLEGNAVGNWLNSTLLQLDPNTEPHDPKDYVTLHKLFVAYTSRHNMQQREFYAQAKAYCVSTGITIKHRVTFRENGMRKELKNVLQNQRML